MKPHSFCSKRLCISQFHLRPAPSRDLLLGICPHCQSRGWGICKFCTAREPGICQPRGHSRAFYRNAVSYQDITTQKVFLEKKKQIGSSVEDRNKQSFGKISTTVVLDKDENLLWSGLQSHRSCHSNEMTLLTILLAAVYLSTENCSSKIVHGSVFLQ